MPLPPLPSLGQQPNTSYPMSPVPPTPKAPAPAPSASMVPPAVLPTPGWSANGQTLSMSLAPHITAPSGATVSPATGSLISHPPIPGTTPAAAGTPPTLKTPAELNNQNPLPSGTATIAGGQTPVAPVVPSPTTPTDQIAPTSPYQQAVNDYQTASTMTPEETAAQKQLTGLQNDEFANEARLRSTPGFQGFKDANQQALTDQNAVQEKSLSDQIANAEAVRQAKMTGAQTLASLEKPESLTYGATYVDPTTGQTINGGIFGGGSGSNTAANFSPLTGLTPGSSTADILGYLSKNGVDVNRYDSPGLINAIQNGATAQDIISGKANIAANIKNAGLTNTSLINTGSGTETINTLANPLNKGGSNLGSSNQPVPVKTNLGVNNVTPAVAGATGLSSLPAGALTLATTGDFASSSKSQDQQNADLAAVRKVIPGFNPAIAKANSAAITEQTTQQADTTRAISAADANFGLLTDTFKNSGVNSNDAPLANQLANSLKLGVLGDSDVANFQSGVSSLQTEYATVLGRGGAVTDSVRSSAKNVIDGNYSMKDLISLHDYIDKEGKNVIDSYSKTISNLASGQSNSSSTKTNLGNNKTSTPTTKSNPLGI